MFLRGEVDVDGLRRLPVRRNLQDGGPTEAAMRDQHLLAKALAADGCGDFGRYSGEVAKLGAVFHGERERHQCRSRGDDFDPELARDFVTEAGCTHLRDRQATGRDRQRGSLEYVPAGVQGEAASVLDSLSARSEEDFYSGFGAFGEEHVENLPRRVVAEELAQCFFVIRNIVFLDEGEKILRRV